MERDIEKELAVWDRFASTVLVIVEELVAHRLNARDHVVFIVPRGRLTPGSKARN